MTRLESQCDRQWSPVACLKTVRMISIASINCQILVAEAIGIRVSTSQALNPQGKDHQVRGMHVTQNPTKAFRNKVKANTKTKILTWLERIKLYTAPYRV